MKTLDITLDIDALKTADEEKEQILSLGSVIVFEALFIQGLNRRYQAGLPLAKGKLLARIQTKLDKLNSSNSILDLEESEFDLVKEVFTSEDSSFGPSQYRAVMQFIRAIESSKADA